MIEIPMLWAIATGLVAGGMAFGGVKVALNGTRERVKCLEDQTAGQADRLARIETKIDLLIEHKHG